jgi:hypothetical protein
MRKLALNYFTVRRIDQMHMIDIGVQSHCGACIDRAAGLDAAANFGAIHGKEDHRLHAKRLDDIQGHREVGSIVAAIVSRFGDVLRPQSKGDRRMIDFKR